MSSNIEEDDWETADMTPPSKSLAPSLPSLRPQAQKFQPRPSQPQLPHQNQPQQPYSGNTGYSRNQPQPQPQPQAGSSRQPQLLQRKPTPQNTEVDGEVDGNDWFRGNKPMSNRQIWDSANSRSSQPQIQILSPQPLPQPKVQLLRRPAGTPSTVDNTNKASNKPKTLVEREEQYRLARERIFGAGSGSGSGSNDQVVAGEVAGGRSKSGEGRKRDTGSGKSSPKSSGTTNVNGEKVTWEGLVPSQIRGGSGSNTPTGGSGNGNRTPSGIGSKSPMEKSSPRSSQGGVVRQPLGPGQGIGFGSPTRSSGGGGGAGGGGVASPAFVVGNQNFSQNQFGENPWGPR